MSRTNIALIALGPIASAVIVMASWNAFRWFRDLLASQGFSDEASGMGASIAALGAVWAIAVACMNQFMPRGG